MTLLSSKQQTQVQALWIKWKHDGDASAQRQLIEHYIPLVDYVTTHISLSLPRNVSKEDIFSYGIMGLYDAVGKYDLSRGLRFETYASWRIRGSIIDGLRQLDWVPRSVREKVRKIEEAYQQLEQKYMRTATVPELCAHLDMAESEFHALLFDISYVNPISLEEPMRPEEQETRMSHLVDEAAPLPENTVKELFMKECLAQAIQRLTPRERTVVSLLYYNELSLSEIAHVMNLSASRISQLHSKAMLRLRHHLDMLKEQLMY